MNIGRKNLKKHGVKFLKKDKKLETLTIKTEIVTKKKFLEYVDLYSRAPLSSHLCTPCLLLRLQCYDLDVKVLSV